jgi:hypothetical protein
MIDRIVCESCESCQSCRNKDGNAGNRALTAVAAASMIAKGVLKAVAYKSTFEIPAGRIPNSYEKV